MSSSSSLPLSEETAVSRCRPCTDEFRRDVVRLIIDEGYSVAAAARACGVCDQIVRNWHGKLALKNASAGVGASVEKLKAEVKRLCKDLKRTEMERAILEKATGISVEYFRSPYFIANAGAYRVEVVVVITDSFPIR